MAEQATLFRWPATAVFGRTVPKTKFYEHGNVRTALRDRFVDEIKAVTWAYKLAEDTIRLASSPEVPEIQIFTVETKGADVSEDVLSAVDRAVHFPIIFEVVSQGRVRMVAARKLLNGKAPKVGTYFTSNWSPVDAARRSLPTVLDLSGLYEVLLMSLLPIDARAGETVSSAIDRLESARKLQREIAVLEMKLRSEPQLNRKVELRRQLRESNATLAVRTDPIPSTKD